MKRNETTMTAEQQAFAIENSATMPLGTIAKALDRCPKSLGKWLRRRGIACFNARVSKLDANHDAYVVANWRTQSDEQMGKAMGICPETVRKMRIKLRIKRPQPKRGGKPRAAPKSKAPPRPSHTAGYFRPAPAIAPKDLADRAAEHIATLDRTPVFRIDRDGKPHPKGNLWRYGTTRLTTDEMMAKATRKGFDPDWWRKLAA